MVNPSPESGFSLRRLALAGLTVIVLLQVGLSLLASWNAPQITNRLQLYQTDLVLRASEAQMPDPQGNGSYSLSATLLGETPLKVALDQYQEVRESAQTNLQRLQTQLQRNEVPTKALVLQAAIQEQQASLHQLDLRLGMLHVVQGEVQKGLETWEPLLARLSAEVPARAAAVAIADTTRVLISLWQEPPSLLPSAEPILQEHLDGWFRYQALTRLYTLQQRTDALQPLQAEAQAIAQQTLTKLALVSLAPLLGSLIGIGLLLTLVIQRISRGKDALLAQNGDTPWVVPWSWDVVLQVLIAGFFFIGQLILPQLLRALIASGLNFSAFGTRAQAFSVLTTYGLMSLTTLGILVLSIRDHLPLSQDWFRFKGSNWLWWGSGGYLVALPLMILISLVNQQIWQGEGGSNPLLQIVLEERDPIALGIFLFTAAIAAPLFEEVLFRGFLLPSLTRYMSVSWAILLSSLIFAVAHLSLSEVLPLAVLGIILGVTYTRSRNLLSSILLHSLWNSVTMIGLFILGSGT